MLLAKLLAKLRLKRVLLGLLKTLVMRHVQVYLRALRGLSLKPHRCWLHLVFSVACRVR